MAIKDLALHALWGLFIFLLGFLLTNLSESIKDLNTELHEFKYSVSTSYARKDDFSRIENKIDKLYDLIYSQAKRNQP